MFHTDGAILIEKDLFAEDLTRYTLSRSLYFVAGPTAEHSPRLVEEFQPAAGDWPRAAGEPGPGPPPHPM